MARVAIVPMSFTNTNESIAVGDFLGDQGAVWGSFKYPRAFVTAAIRVSESEPLPRTYSHEELLGLVACTQPNVGGEVIIEHATVDDSVVMEMRTDDLVERLGDHVATVEAGMMQRPPENDRTVDIISTIGSVAGVTGYQEATF